MHGLKVDTLNVIHFTVVNQFSELNRVESQGDIDHDDPSKPSHHLTNGPEPSKTIESDGRKIKNHRKTIDGNGQTA